MARTNKYTTLNFNDIYEKKATSTANKHRRSSSLTTTSLTTPPGNKTILSNSRIHGNMLVLSLPSPKPVVPPSQPSPPLSPAADRPGVEKDTISLRPLGRTGSGPPVSLSPLTSPGGQKPKTNKFVPPHLRPGFVGKEEKPRPKSGCGYERMRRGFEGDTVSRSMGSTRPNSSG